MTKQCGTCQYWKKTTDYENIPNEGTCRGLSEKVTVDVHYGWDGGYFVGFQTEEDFGCSLYQTHTSS